MNRNLRKSENADNQDLDWLAFCYISDEMSESDRESFESRLESDSLAQQALVDAVEQTQLIYASRLETEAGQTVQLASVEAKTNPSWSKRPGVLFTAAAAMLLIVIGWSLSGDTSPSDDSEIANTVSNTTTTLESNLAVAWADTLVEKDSLLVDNIEEEFLDDFDQYSLAGPVEEMDESEDWMFVALTDMEDSSEDLE